MHWEVLSFSKSVACDIDRTELTGLLHENNAHDQIKQIIKSFNR